MICGGRDTLILSFIDESLLNFVTCIERHQTFFLGLYEFSCVVFFMCVKLKSWEEKADNIKKTGFLLFRPAK